MRSAVFLRNIICVAKHAFVISIGPLNSGFDLNIISLTGEINNFFMQRSFRFVDVRDKSLQAAFIMKINLTGLSSTSVNQFEVDAGVQESLFANGTFQRFKIKFGLRKSLRRGQERNFGTMLPRSISHDFKVFGNISVGKSSQMFFSVAPNTEFEPGRQGINHGNAHTVQPAGNLVRIVIELSAGVKLGHNHLSGRNTFFLVNIDRNTAAVITNGCRPVGIKDNFGFITITSQSFINGIIKNFINHVVQTRAVIGIADIHPRTFAHGVQPFQNLDRISTVFFFFLINFLLS